MRREPIERINSMFEIILVDIINHLAI
ncbi:protein of unknown function [Mesotoga infera]|uniref:Uncharacterized protein n=1 Tax=Mesotoga infera TaxID=1236046 RepID=A0A7Z7LF22_9BACT|nr:protein of unknown function [Mesotoga infera]